MYFWKFFSVAKKYCIFTPIWRRNNFQLLKNIVFLLQYWRGNFFQQKKRMCIKYVFLEIFLSKRRTLGADFLFIEIFFSYIQFIIKFYQKNCVFLLQYWCRNNFQFFAIL